MSILVPLLLPGIVNATANVALGITNAVQGTSSNVSLKIGNRVFTTNTPFPFDKLPAELRMEIILWALEMSRDLIIPPMDFVPPFNPLRPGAQYIPAGSHHNNPLDPRNPHYRSIVGEATSANGYPLSVWRWMSLNSEWRDVVRRQLWKRCVIQGQHKYRTIERMMERKDFDLFNYVEELELHQGFGEPTTLYTFLRHPQLTNLTSISILPVYPFSPDPFENILAPFDFGLQLIPVPTPDSPRLKHLAFGLPLELTTNAAGRQHLRRIAPEKLSVTVLRPNVSLFEELRDGLSGTIEVLSVRYLAVSIVRDLMDPAILVNPILDAFKHVHLHLPSRAHPILCHPYTGQTDRGMSMSDRVVEMIQMDEGRRKRYTVWVEHVNNGFNADMTKREEMVFQPEMSVEEILAAEEETRRRLESNEKEEGEGGKKDKGKQADRERDMDKTWERETNLKLLGGLISLRLESKKR